MKKFDKILERIFVEVATSNGEPLIYSPFYINAADVERIANHEKVPPGEVIKVIESIGGEFIAHYKNNFCIIFPKMFPEEIYLIIKKAGGIVHEIAKKITPYAMNILGGVCWGNRLFCFYKERSFSIRYKVFA